MEVCVAEESRKPKNARQVEACLKPLGTITIKCGRKDYSGFKEIGDFWLVVQTPEIVIGVEQQIMAELLLKPEIHLCLAAGTNGRKRGRTGFFRRTEYTRAC